MIFDYLVSERKLGFFVQIKEGKNFNRRNTLSISRINPAAGGIECDADMGEKDSFRSGTIYEFINFDDPQKRQALR